MWGGCASISSAKTLSIDFGFRASILHILNIYSKTYFSEIKLVKILLENWPLNFKGVIKVCRHYKALGMQLTITVGENFNGATKMQNNYGAIKVFIYCVINIGLFPIGPCKVILLCLLYFILCIPSFSYLSFYSYRDSDSCHSFSLLKAIAIRFSLLFSIRAKRATTIDIAKVGRAITIWEATQKRSHESMYKND